MSKSENKTFVSIIFIALLALIAGLSATWVSGQTGSIPSDLQPGEVVIVAYSESGGMHVGITLATGDNNGLVEYTVILGGGVVAQTSSDDGSIIMEGVDAYNVRGYGDGVGSTVSNINLSLMSQELLAEMLMKDLSGRGVEINGVTRYAALSNEIDVMCLTDFGEWTAETVTSSVWLTPLSNFTSGKVIDFQVEVIVQSRQNGTCATFVNRDNYANVNVQRRADILDTTEPANGGIGSEVESYYNDPTID
ncbi:MAG: hypothetical protein ACPG8W_02515 [Candidatus Promineifilaceae bacterium]